MREDQVTKARGYLSSFLGKNDYTPEKLLSEVEEVFGTPELVLATGSILAGLGNSMSDVDLIVVVRNKSLSDLPIMSFPSNLKVDTEYYDADDVRSNIHLIQSSKWPLQEPLDPPRWQKFVRGFKLATRLQASYPLIVTEQWKEVLQTLGEDWLRQSLVSWWHTEALRCRLAARWTVSRSPLLASIRMGDALLTALHKCAVERGEIYFHRKWIGQKLRRLNDERLLGSYERVFDPTMSDADDLAKYKRLDQECELLLKDVPDYEYQYVLRLAKQTEILDAPTGRLVSQWGMKGLLFEPAELRSFDSKTGIVAAGSINDAPERDVMELYQHGMCWLSVNAVAAGGVIHG
ncbi:hypothetical protein V1294_006822 [Bradyrhizobium sp. AZCC 1678]|uniref:hypothetical protein n=1 Tax=Bradyrhizobium sp. AZCC 1678 TaxID=3117030 RepID=UPI002FEFAF28